MPRECEYGVVHLLLLCWLRRTFIPLFSFGVVFSSLFFSFFLFLFIILFHWSSLFLFSFLLFLSAFVPFHS